MKEIMAQEEILNGDSRAATNWRWPLQRFRWWNVIRIEMTDTDQCSRYTTVSPLIDHFLHVNADSRPDSGRKDGGEATPLLTKSTALLIGWGATKKKSTSLYIPTPLPVWLQMFIFLLLSPAQQILKSCFTWEKLWSEWWVWSGRKW